MSKEFRALEILKRYRDNEYYSIEFPTTIQTDEAIKELEELENIDRLAELEKVILDYYLDKGYQVGIGEWAFNVEIDSDYKSKVLTVHFAKGDGLPYSKVFQVQEKTTKEMFDKAFEFFQLKKENKDG
jgi:hypothetical protein